MLLAITAAICANCHPAIVRDYLQSPMGRSAGIVSVAAEAPGAFQQLTSSLRFAIRATARGLEMRAGPARMNLSLYIGSKQHGRSFVENEKGYLYEAPVGYYKGHGWDMAPGYQNDREPDTSRPVTPECLGCHAGGVTFDRTTVNRVNNPEEITGIGCERCHGDAQTHAKTPRKDNIVGPSRLSAAARDSVCEQCHLSGAARIPLPGKHPEDFRPGENLAGYLDVFIKERPDKSIAVNSHAEALARSRCRLASGERMWCGTCHRVHSTVSDYRAACAGCHDGSACAHAGEGACITCHMPKGKAYDGSHTVFTDHTIPRNPQKASPLPTELRLKPFFSDPRTPALLARAQGLAYAADRDLAWPLLRQALQSISNDPVLLTEVAWFLQSAGRDNEAAKLYRESLALDPYQNAALINLAGLALNAGNKAESTSLLSRALRMNPRQPAAGKGIRMRMDERSH